MTKPKGQTEQVAQLDRIERLLNELVRDCRHRRVVEQNELFEREMRESLMTRESRVRAENAHLARLEEIHRGLP